MESATQLPEQNPHPSDRIGVWIAGIGLAFVIGWIGHGKYYNIQGTWSKEHRLEARVHSQESLTKHCLQWDGEGD